MRLSTTLLVALLAAGCTRGGAGSQDTCDPQDVGSCPAGTVCDDRGGGNHCYLDAPPCQPSSCPAGWTCTEAPTGNGVVCQRDEVACGNGLVDLGEQCDGDDLEGATCTSLGFNGGPLSCSESCTLDTSGCEIPPSACLDRTDPEFQNWPDDSDLEPNDSFATAVTLPCGGSPHDPNYWTQCPTRDNYTNGFMALVICPEGETDHYGLYLLAGETALISLLYEYEMSVPRDLDLDAYYHDEAINDFDPVATGASTNHNEEIVLSSVPREGWYYLVVRGKGPTDINQYVITFVLNPPTP